MSLDDCLSLQLPFCLHPSKAHLNTKAPPTVLLEKKLMDKLRNLLRKYNIEDSTLPTTEELSFEKMSSCVQDNAAAARKTERLLLLAKQGLL